MISKEKRRQYFLTVNGKATSMYSSAKYTAKCHNLEFNLTTQWIIKKIKQGRCEMTGMKFTLEAPRKGYFHNPYSPSLDRHDQTKGYTKDNVKVVIWAYNQAKGQWNRKHFRRIIKAIYKRMFNSCHCDKCREIENEQKITRPKDTEMAEKIQHNYRLNREAYPPYDY